MRLYLFHKDKVNFLSEKDTINYTKNNCLQITSFALYSKEVRKKQIKIKAIRLFVLFL